MVRARRWISRTVPPVAMSSRSSSSTTQHLVDADAAAVAGAEALGAADGVVELDALARRGAEAELLPARVADGLGLAAVPAQAAHETLGHEAAPGRGHQVAGHAHLDEAVDGCRGVVGVQGAEDLMAGDGGVGGHLGGLEIADLADHDDVGVGAHQRAQRLGEREADGRFDLGLHDAGDLALDRVLDGVHLALR